MFKEWDRVIVNNSMLINEKGTVLGGINPAKLYNAYPIRIDSGNTCGARHGCNGLCEKTHGFYVCAENLTLITNKEQTA